MQLNKKISRNLKAQLSFFLKKENIIMMAIEIAIPD